MKKIFLIFALGILLIGSLGFVLAQTTGTTTGTSYCAEKTTTGAWCQNVPLDKIDKNYRSVPTSCESTSYCRLGTCIDSDEGTCMENTPQQVCEDNNGFWKEGKPDEIPQCQLGCCLLGDQASFTTQSRCKKLSAVYGLETDYRKDIRDEVSCIASATSDVKGACVFEQEFTRTCVMTSKKDCLSRGTVNRSSVEFHEGFLCSAETLGTNCGPSEKTTCIDGKDQVFYVDTCGNVANVYDSSKLKDKNYWNELVDVGASCNPGSGNADSKSCGNCDYFLGSTCKKYLRGEDKSRPEVGDYICRDLSCEYDGQQYQHGETWCADTEGVSSLSPDNKETDIRTENLPGSRYFRMVCYNGDVSIEPCADFRNEVCLQTDINGFSAAACVVNKWQECYAQSEKKDCENTDRRDCRWIKNAVLGNGQEVKKSEGACVPKIAPGFAFWGATESAGVGAGVQTGAGNEATEICNQASAKCVVTYQITKTLSGETKECVSGCECLKSSWENDMKNACVSLGDCGVKVNYIGVQGFHDEYKIESKKKKR